MERWKFERQNYPGWLIAAEDKRSAVWEKTTAWIQPLIEFAKIRHQQIVSSCFAKSTGGSKFRWLLSFRNGLSHSKRPWTSWSIPWRRGSRSDLRTTSTQAIKCQPRKSPTHYLTSPLVFYERPAKATTLVAWHELKSKIDKLVRQNGRHSDRSRYEDALWAIWNVDRASAKSTLSNWLPSLRSPLALMRKAGLLAELDELGEARTILRIALDEIRKAVRIQGRNIELLSLVRTHLET